MGRKYDDFVMKSTNIFISQPTADALSALPGIAVKLRCRPLEHQSRVAGKFEFLVPRQLNAQFSCVRRSTFVWAIQPADINS
jgi:hypothetical protein